MFCATIVAALHIALTRIEKICHKLQTSTKGMEIKDRVFLRKQFETFATAQKLEHERTGRIPDYERLDWTVEATSMWLSACKMRRSGDTDSSIKLLEGSMWKRNKIGEWVPYFYVVSGSETIPGLLSCVAADGVCGCGGAVHKGA